MHGFGQVSYIYANKLPCRLSLDGVSSEMVAGRC